MKHLIFLMILPFAGISNAQSKLVLDLSQIPHQKYEYRYLQHNDVPPQIVYQIKTDEMILFIEVQVSETPEDLNQNGTIIFNLNQQEQLNNLRTQYNEGQKILVLDDFKIQYDLSSISFLKSIDENKSTYHNWKYKFELNQAITNKGEIPTITNLQPGGNKMEYIESLFLNCMEIFIIRQYYSSNNEFYTEINYHPTIGILKESNVNNFGKTELELFSINDQPLKNYLNSICEPKVIPSLTLREKGNGKLNKEYHVVQKGETLYQIAKKYNISTAKIMAINNLESSIINIGDVLYLDDTTQPSFENNKPLIETHPEMFDTPLKNPQGRVGQNNGNALLKRGLPQKYAASNSSSLDTKRQVHYVLSGETLYSIARKYNTTVKVLIEINQLDQKNPKIQPDQKLYIN